MSTTYISQKRWLWHCESILSVHPNCVILFMVNQTWQRWMLFLGAWKCKDWCTRSILIKYCALLWQQHWKHLISCKGLKRKLVSQIMIKNSLIMWIRPLSSSPLTSRKCRVESKQDKQHLYIKAGCNTCYSVGDCICAW